MKHRRMGAVFALSLAAAVALTGCASEGSDLSKQWEESNEKGYISGDGTSASFPISERTDPVQFEGEVESGDTVTSDDILGKVTVVNFWYAGCAPCRAEAPELVAAYDEFAGDDVAFLGINTRDQVAQAEQFAAEFGIEYPSIMDVAGGRAVQRAFAGQVPLNAVPTTLILDAEGRVAHRVLGQLSGSSQLPTLIKETLAEGAGDGEQASQSSVSEPAE